MENQNLQRPGNNLALAIFSTVCCCVPLGVVAIIKASKVNDLFDQGRIDEAQQNADEAKKYALISIACGFVVNVIVFIVRLMIEMDS